MAGAFKKQLTQSKANSEHNPQGYSSEAERMLLKFSQVKRELKGVQSFEKRAEIKQNAYPYFKDWIEANITQNTGKPDRVISYWFVWLLDLEDYEKASTIYLYLARNGLPLPEEFKRPLHSFFIETLAEQAQKKRLLKEKISTKLLKEMLKLVEPYDVSDHAKAKLLREIGIRQLERKSLIAEETLKEALRLDHKCGAKTYYRKAEKLSHQMLQGKTSV